MPWSRTTRRVNARDSPGSASTSRAWTSSTVSPYFPLSARWPAWSSKCCFCFVRDEPSDSRPMVACRKRPGRGVGAFGGDGGRAIGATFLGSSSKDTARSGAARVTSFLDGWRFAFRGLGRFFFGFFFFVGSAAGATATSSTEPSACSSSSSGAQPK